MKSLLSVELKHAKNYTEFKTQTVNDCVVVTAVDRRDGNRYAINTTPLTEWWQ